MPINGNGFRDLQEGAVLLKSKLAGIDDALLCHVVSRKDSTLDSTPFPVSKWMPRVESGVPDRFEKWSFSLSNAQRPVLPKVVVASTVMLSFISFWRAAAIVLSDLASSAFYVGGIAEKAIGRSAPWFILGVMLFSFAVRSVYMESCSMYVRGGVYVVVRDAMGPFMARLSVSALIFDYILTGPISAVSAGQYLGHLLNEISELLQAGIQISPA